MRIRPLLSVLGFLLVAVGLAMLTSLGFALHFHEEISPVLWSAVCSIGCGSVMLVFFRKDTAEELGLREGFAIVTLGWIITPLFGSLPFMISGAIPSFTDAYFETISGFTTTGASILTDVESLPKWLLYWRSLTHWLGGMGIIVLSLAILPLLGIGGMQLYKAEFAGPTKDKLTPRIAETARLLWGVYLLFTVVETLLLMGGGMSFFDAVCHAFATIATGGFSTKNASIAAFNSAYIEWVITIFMFLSGTNFVLHFALLKGEFRYFKDDEFVFYLVSLLIASGIVTVSLLGMSAPADLETAIRHSLFSLSSVMSSTGFVVADFALWAPIAQITILFMMFPGACGGSTGGGMKNIRVLLLLKAAVNEIKKLIHPKLVVPVRHNGRMVEPEVLFTIAGFMILYLVTFSTATILLAATGLDLVTSFSAAVSAMSNVGPGLGSVGPTSNYAHLTDLAKWILSAGMLLGRLEIYTVFVLFSSSFWKK
jgi:trk system potassium uptake protein TrkH